MNILDLDRVVTLRDRLRGLACVEDALDVEKRDCLLMLCGTYHAPGGQRQVAISREFFENAIEAERKTVIWELRKLGVKCDNFGKEDAS